MANKRRTVADVRKAILDSESEDLLDGDYNESDLETEEEKRRTDGRVGGRAGGLAGGRTDGRRRTGRRSGGRADGWAELHVVWKYQKFSREVRIYVQNFPGG